MTAQTRIAIALAGIAALTAAVAVVVVGLGLGLRAQGPTTREVRLRIEGVPPDAPLAVLEARGPLAMTDGYVDLGTRAAPSVVRVDWVLGPGCAETCPDHCPGWCLSGSHTVDVTRGSGPLESPMTVLPPAPRDVVVVADLSLDRASLDGDPTVPDGPRATFGAIVPGPHEVALEVGTCPPEARGCTSSGDRCPDGCISWVQSISVPVGEGEVRIALALPEAGTPVPAEPAAQRPARGPVTGEAFARFVAEHPEWARDAAVSAGRADARYLKSWGPGPPPGPVTQVTWSAAAAYCVDRGGLLGIEAAPTTWDRSIGVTQEWRDDGGQPAWRRFDGARSGQTPPPNQAFSFTGFRCER